jgi:glycine/D-amino acid oxidase-like deaminating enzyme
LTKSCVVVGAGALGACTALRLAERGLQVTLVDAAAPGDGTTANTFAWVGASPVGLRDYFEINVDGMAAHRRLALELGRDDYFVQTGCLTWSTDPAGQNRTMERVRDLAAGRYSAAEVTPAWVNATLEPDLQFADEVEVVAWYPDEGFILTKPFVSAVLEAARRAGATLRIGCRVTELALSGGAVCGVVLEDGERLEANVVVSCVGRWTSDLAADVGVNVPLVSPNVEQSAAVGLLVLTTAARSSLQRMLLPDEVMIRPDGGGRMLIHADEFDRRITADLETQPVPAIAEELREVAARYVPPLGDARVEAARVGIRALPEDGLPVIGHTAVDGFYVVVTHSGITLSARVGELVAAEVATGREEPALARFRPQRFARAAAAS